MQISQNFVIRTFFQYCKRPIFKKNALTYNAECPYCHEGNSKGKKRRFFYIPKDDLLYCHNCGETKNGLQFITNMTGMNLNEILIEAESHSDSLEDIIKKSTFFKKINPRPLPDDSINLFDSSQVSYYKENPAVKEALEFIKRRRLDTAINRPRALFISLTDYTHKNRLVIPFYSPDGVSKVEFYQSRSLFKQDENIAKYLSKTNSEKGLFNIDKIDPDIEYIFLQEGPIDAMFLRNSVALAGIKSSEDQMDRIKAQYPLYTIVFVLDNQWLDKTSYNESIKLLERGERVFIWPKALIEYKDLNDICVSTQRDEIKWEIIIKHTFKGMEGLLEMSHINLVTA